MLKARECGKVIKGLRGKAFDIRTHSCGSAFHPRWVVTGIELATGKAFMVRDFAEWQRSPQNAMKPVVNTAIRSYGF